MHPNEDPCKKLVIWTKFKTSVTRWLTQPTCRIRHVSWRIRHVNWRLRHANWRLRHANWRLRHANWRIRHASYRNIFCGAKFNVDEDVIFVLITLFFPTPPGVKNHFQRQRLRRQRHDFYVRAHDALPGRQWLAGVEPGSTKWGVEKRGASHSSWI